MTTFPRSGKNVPLWNLYILRHCVDVSLAPLPGTVTQFFNELRDAPANASLALCASTVLFVLSQDRLNMDLDRDSLELMLNLLDTDSRIKDALETSGMNRRELEKNKQKVSE